MRQGGASGPLATSTVLPSASVGGAVMQIYRRNLWRPVDLADPARRHGELAYKSGGTTNAIRTVDL
jgi:hypothetical protein